jgi:hypothetical protein
MPVNTDESVEMSGDEIPTVEELLAGLPCDSVARENSIAMIAEAYYNAGLGVQGKTF